MRRDPTEFRLRFAAWKDGENYWDTRGEDMLPGYSGGKTGFYSTHRNKWRLFLISKGVGAELADRLSTYFAALDSLESGNGTSSAAKQKNNFGGMLRGGKNISYDTVQDYMNDKWNMMNKRFSRALNAKTVQEYATLINDPKYAGKGYLYAVADGYNQKNPLDRAWVARQILHMNNYTKAMMGIAGLKGFVARPVPKAPVVSKTEPIEKANPIPSAVELLEQNELPLILPESTITTQTPTQAAQQAQLSEYIQKPLVSEKVPVLGGDYWENYFNNNSLDQFQSLIQQLMTSHKHGKNILPRHKDGKTPGEYNEELVELPEVRVDSTTGDVVQDGRRGSVRLPNLEVIANPIDVGRGEVARTLENAFIESNDATATPYSTNSHLNYKGIEGMTQAAAWMKDHPTLNNVGMALGAAPFAVAGYPAFMTAGEGTAAALTNPYIDAALTSGFGAHGLNHVFNEGIDGWGDAAMTALEITPLGRLARPMYNAGKEAVYNIADRYIFMPHSNSFTRGIGMTDAGLQDAVTTGVFRGNPRGTEVTAKQFTKLFERNRDNFRDIMDATGIEGIASKFQSRTLSEAEFNAIKEAAKKYKMKRLSFDNGSFSPVELSADPLYEYPDYASYIKSVNETIANVEKMPSRIASGEIKVNTELTPTVDGVPHGRPIEERFGPNSDYVGDGQPLSYWYDDGRNPLTRGHSYARSNYGVRVNNPEDYTPFMHELHLHPSFFKTPQLADPNVEIFGKGPLGLTVKLDKETLQPLWKKDLSNIFKGNKVISPQITAENAASITPEQWTAAQDAAIARGDIVEAQRLRDLHFKVSAPNTATSVNGQPLQLYHGTNATFNAFELSKFGKTDAGTFGRGVYTTPVKEYAELYGENIMPLYMKLDNPRDYRNSSMGDLIFEKLAFGDDFATGIGIDGVIGRPSWKGFKGLEEYVSHNPRNIKSSFPITYDNKGVRIPLGERDNFSINDIRYGIVPFLGIGGAAYGLSEYKHGKNPIHINPANRGKFNALKKRTGKTTELLTHSKNPLTRKRAVFALNSRKWRRK